MDQYIWIVLLVIIAAIGVYYFYTKEHLTADVPVTTTDAPAAATPATMDAGKAVAALAEAAASSTPAPVENVKAAGAVAADACTTQAGVDAVSALCQQAVAGSAGDSQKVADTANTALADINGEIQGVSGGNYASAGLDQETVPNQALLPGVSQDVAAFDANMPNAATIADNFINPGYEYNIDTIASSNKNPNLDLRPRPPVPLSDIGFSNLSSWAMDQNTKYDLSTDPEYKLVM